MFFARIAISLLAVMRDFTTKSAVKWEINVQFVVNRHSDLTANVAIIFDAKNNE